MTIVRAGTPKVFDGQAEHPHLGPWTEARYSDAGGLTQFGAHVVTLEPGSRASDLHWHEEEDEFLYLLDGEAVVIEADGEHLLHPGDAACWPAGVADPHTVVNRSDAPCRFLIVGTRGAREAQHYPELKRTTFIDGRRWRVVDDRTGAVLREGEDL